MRQSARAGVLTAFVIGVVGLTGAIPRTVAKAQEQAPVYKDAKAPLEARVSDLLGRLTQDEKISLLSGTGFGSRPIPRLDIPSLEMVDAGQGVRGGTSGTQGPATAFPSGIAMAATWNPELAGRIGKAIGEETLNKGTGAQILLGPDVNIHRSPLGGRNGESFSEDPYLAGRLAVGYIEGMQSSGASACIKHFACNNEEQDRMTVDVKVSERALREIYFPAFEMGIKEAKSLTLMSSYNVVNGFHSSANKYLLTDVLKNQWGFDGLVMSDWGGVHTTAGTVASGNDLEMPNGQFLSVPKVRAALAAGEVTQAQIDDSVRRLLRTIIRLGYLDHAKPTPNHAMVNSPAHQKVAFEGAAEGLVLLKNDHAVLPLNRAKIKSLAVIGPRAESWQIGAGGSPAVQPFYTVNALEGIKKSAGSGVTVKYLEGVTLEGGVGIPVNLLTPPDAAGPAIHGLRGEYFANKQLEGTPVLTRVDSMQRLNWNQRAPGQSIPRTDFSARWTGTLTAPTTGQYEFTIRADDGCRMFIDGKQVLDHWVDSNGPAQTAHVDLVAGKRYDIRIEYYQAAGDAFMRLSWKAPHENHIAEAAEFARTADAAIIVVGTPNEGEGHDRSTMDLPGEQDALIRAVTAANPKTVVVLNNGTPVNMSGWLKQTPALVDVWFPGQEGGNALGAALFGDINPSGKLPDTLAMHREDYPDFGNFPGKNDKVDYAEDIYVGYRHFDKKKITPAFPFGHGLSYTTFKYTNLTLTKQSMAPGDTIYASMNITNTGKREGAEVVELYIRDPNPKIDKPVRELKAFVKVRLKPGEMNTVHLALTGRSLAYFDTPNKRWKADAGSYVVEVGASSRDIRATTSLKLAQDFTEGVER